MKTIDVARDYTPFLGGRYVTDGPGNAEDFRKKFLVPLLQNGESAIIDLEGVFGFPASFFDEAFGGLVRDEGYPADRVLTLLKFKGETPGLPVIVNAIKELIRNPENETKNKSFEPI